MTSPQDAMTHLLLCPPNPTRASGLLQLPALGDAGEGSAVDKINSPFPRQCGSPIRQSQTSSSGDVSGPMNSSVGICRRWDCLRLRHSEQNDVDDFATWEFEMRFGPSRASKCHESQSSAVSREVCDISIIDSQFCGSTRLAVPPFLAQSQRQRSKKHGCQVVLSEIA